MKLLTKEIINKLPLDVKDGESAPIIVKFFNPMGNQRWYIVSAQAILKNSDEYIRLSEIKDREIEDINFFGYVTGMGFDEWGYISFNELKEIKLPMGMGIERDLHFNNCTVKQIIAKETY